jgi:RHS repeat-associated protein
VGLKGYYFDSDFLLYFLRSRYYKPSLGTFLSTDLVLPGRSLYQYVENRPTIAIDPSGLIWIYSRSGINSPEGTDQTVRDDVKKYADLRGRPYCGHIWSGIRTANLLNFFQGTPPQQLNAEAREKAQMFEAGEYCKREPSEKPCVNRKKMRCREISIGVVMVAPKPNLAVLRELRKTPCCKIKFMVLHSVWDKVPQQGFQFGFDYEVDWATEAGTDLVYNIRLGGWINHGWNNTHGRRGISGSPFSRPLNQQGFSLTGSTWGRRYGDHPLDYCWPRRLFPFWPPALMRFGNQFYPTGPRLERPCLPFRPRWRIKPVSEGPFEFARDIDTVLSADKDYGFVCHSQGCNITVYELYQKCYPGGLPGNL